MSRSTAAESREKMDSASRCRERNSSSPASSERGGVADGSEQPPSRTRSPPDGGSFAAGRASSPAPSDANKSNGKGSASARPSSGAEQQQQKHAPPTHSGQSSDVDQAGAPGREPQPSGHRRRIQRDSPEEGVEKDAAHFKMVADRFRALMERRERKLEEAMSDPQTRRDLEVMFPGVITGDYVTLLAGVRGMEEEDFQDLLDAARKRRREVKRPLLVRFFFSSQVVFGCWAEERARLFVALQALGICVLSHFSKALRQISESRALCSALGPVCPGREALSPRTRPLGWELPVSGR